MYHPQERRFPVTGCCRLGAFICALTMIGCQGTRDFIIAEHEFTVAALQESTATEIQKELEAANLKVRFKPPKQTTKVDGKSVGTYTFVIKDDNYSTDKFREIVEGLRDHKRSEPLSLSSTHITQKYTSASGSGSGEIIINLTLTEGAIAYYKDSRKPVRLKQDGKSLRLHYKRKKNEEYVDIYIIPASRSPDDHPNTFHRFPLTYPYEPTIMEWDPPWYMRLLAWCKKQLDSLF